MWLFFFFFDTVIICQGVFEAIWQGVPGGTVSGLCVKPPQGRCALVGVIPSLYAFPAGPFSILAKVCVEIANSFVVTCGSECKYLISPERASFSTSPLREYTLVKLNTRLSFVECVLTSFFFLLNLGVQCLWEWWGQGSSNERKLTVGWFQPHLCVLTGSSRENASISCRAAS